MYKSFKEMPVWEDAMNLAVDVYWFSVKWNSMLIK